MLKLWHLVLTSSAIFRPRISVRHCVVYVCNERNPVTVFETPCILRQKYKKNSDGVPRCKEAESS